MVLVLEVVRVKEQVKNYRVLTLSGRNLAGDGEGVPKASWNTWL